VEGKTLSNGLWEDPAALPPLLWGEIDGDILALFVEDLNPLRYFYGRGIF
jgi:hypothetical protein